MDQDKAHWWHVAINQHHARAGSGDDRRPWMYEAKAMSLEVPRLALLFKMARTGTLPKIHQQCSHSRPVAVPENYLTCCLGVKCHDCQELQALDAIQHVAPETIDEAKAWTCATHIAFNGGDRSGEGYLMTVDDRMYWDRVYANLAGGDSDPEARGEGA